MALAEKDLRRAAEAVVARQGDAAALSVKRYVKLLRVEKRDELAEYWQRIANWIEALRPRSLH